MILSVNLSDENFDFQLHLNKGKVVMWIDE